MIVLIVVGSVLGAALIAGAVVFTVIFIRRKKAALPTEVAADDNTATEKGDAEALTAEAAPEAIAEENTAEASESADEN